MTRTLPASFRLIHLALAREPDHPEGSPQDGYTLLLPIGPDDRIREEEAEAFADACRVGRVLGGEDVDRGHVRRGPGGRWLFDYGGIEAETAFRFSEQRFRPGEYVSIRRGGEEHAYRVISLQPLATGAKLFPA